MNIENTYKAFEKSYLKVLTIISNDYSDEVESPIQCCNYIFAKFLFVNRYLQTNILNYLDRDENYERISNMFEDIEQLFPANLLKLSNFELNNLLGRFFEKYITKKESGAYYTPKNVVDYINENIILSKIISEYQRKERKANDVKIGFDEVILKKIDLDFFTKNFLDKKILEEVISNLSIIDISVGSGNFIFNAYNLLFNIIEYHKLDVKETLINNFYGIDIDSEAIEILKFRWCILICNKSNNINFFLDLNHKYLNLNPLNVSRKDIFNNKKFDIVLGNPPYLEYSKVKDSYEINNFKSIKCGNLYAFILEKSLDILKKDGHYGFIIPISFVSTKRMGPIRNLFLEYSENIFCSNFSDRPGCLFNGVHQKLTILLGNKNSNIVKPANLYSTEYIHWYANNLDQVFGNLKYYKSNLKFHNFSLKVGNELGNRILKKVNSNSDKQLLDNLSPTGNHNVFVNMRMTFWAKSFFNKQVSKEYKAFPFNSELDAILFSAIINSDLFFFVWECVSDVWHITQKDLNFISVNFNTISNDDKNELKESFMKFYNSLISNRVYIGSKQIEYIYHHKKEKKLIDIFSDKVAEIFNLDEEEKDFIKNYNLKFRMNDELINYLNSN